MVFSYLRTRSMEGSLKAPFNEGEQLEIPFGPIERKDIGHCDNPSCNNYYKSTQEPYCSHRDSCTSSKPKCSMCREVFVDSVGKICDGCKAKTACYNCGKQLSKNGDTYSKNMDAYLCENCMDTISQIGTCVCCHKDDKYVNAKGKCGTCNDEFSFKGKCYNCKTLTYVNISDLCYDCSEDFFGGITD